MQQKTNLMAAFFRCGHPASEEVQRLRTRIFVDACGWSLSVEDGCERDAHDTHDAVYALLRESGLPRACFRAVRTDGRYLAADVFPGLASVRPYPHRADIWEISRFGVATDATSPDGDLALGRMTYALMFWFARQVGATSLVAVADLAHERLLRAIGIRTRRYGPPQVVGHDRTGRPLSAVAGEIPLAAQPPERLQALLALLDSLEITDDSAIFGPVRVSA